MFCPLSPGLEVIKHFPCSTQLSMKSILFINVKLPTVSMINTASERLEARNVFINFVGIIVFYEQLKFRAQLS